MSNKINQIDVMFKHTGKASKFIGSQRLKAYEEAYNHITDMQNNGELLISDDYLGGNENIFLA